MTLASPPNLAAVTVKKVIPPNSVVATLRIPPNRMAGAVIARRLRLLPARGRALGPNNGMNGRAMEKPAMGNIAKNEINFFPCEGTGSHLQAFCDYIWKIESIVGIFLDSKGVTGHFEDRFLVAPLRAGSALRFIVVQFSSPCHFRYYFPW